MNKTYLSLIILLLCTVANAKSIEYYASNGTVTDDIDGPFECGSTPSVFYDKDKASAFVMADCNDNGVAGAVTQTNYSYPSIFTMPGSHDNGLNITGKLECFGGLSGWCGYFIELWNTTSGDFQEVKSSGLSLGINYVSYAMTKNESDFWLVNNNLIANHLHRVNNYYEYHGYESWITLFTEETPPTWNQTPTDQIILSKSTWSYTITATDTSGIDTYFLNDTTNFTINGDTGEITVLNLSNSNTGIPITLLVNDTWGNTLNESVVFYHAYNPLFNCTEGNLIFTFINETDNGRGKTDIALTIDITNPSTSNASFEATNVFNYSICIFPEWANYTINAIIEYGNTNGYTTRHYFLQGAEITNITNSISLYTLLTSEDNVGAITFSIQSPEGIAQQGVIIRAQKYDIGTNTYRLVAMGKSDVEGVATVYLQKYEWYRFVLIEDGMTLRIFEDMWLADTDIVLKTSALEGDETLNHWRSGTSDCTWNEYDAIFSCQVDDTSGLSPTTSLIITREAFMNISTICNSVDTGASVTLICDISAYNRNNSDIRYLLNASYSNPGERILRQGYISKTNDVGVWGTDGAVLASFAYWTLAPIGFVAGAIPGFLMLIVATVFIWVTDIISLGVFGKGVTVGIAALLSIVAYLIGRRMK